MTDCAVMTDELLLTNLLLAIWHIALGQEGEGGGSPSAQPISPSAPNASLSLPYNFLMSQGWTLVAR